MANRATKLCRRLERQLRTSSLTTDRGPHESRCRSSERGFLKERLVLEAIGDPFWPPPWFISIRAATKNEDMRGIDAVVTIDIGEVLVQVKSTQNGARNHRRHYERSCYDYDNTFVVIIVPDHSTPMNICLMLWNLLRPIRRHRLARRAYHLRRRSTYEMAG